MGFEQSKDQDEQPSPEKEKQNKYHSAEQHPKPYITVPYYKGLSESVKKKCSNYGVQVYFKGGTTIKNLLMVPKDHLQL